METGRIRRADAPGVTATAGDTGTRRRWLSIATGIAVIAGIAAVAGIGRRAGAAEQGVKIAPPKTDIATGGASPARMVVAGGCFWGVQGVFQHVRGVLDAVSGYSGGKAEDANYTAVSHGRTGHAEAVQVTYDPAQVSYGTLLQIFFSVAHNPTELNRQGPDVGPQYRSAIFPVDAEQQRVARAYIAELDAAKVFRAPIVTRIEEGQRFYQAEAYHQDYMTEHPNDPYILINDRPKIVELRKLFPDRFRPEPVLVKRNSPMKKVGG